MDIELIAQNRVNGIMYSLGEVAGEITWDTEISGQPGKLTFPYIMDENVTLEEGSVVRLKVAGQGVFFGYIFKRQINSAGQIKVTAYDQMRYLKNSATYVIKDLTASQVFEKVCKDTKLKGEVRDESTYKLASRVIDDKSYGEILETVIDETLAYSTMWFMVQDDFGTLKFIDLRSYWCPIVIGDESLLTSFDFSSSIDSDTYNEIKLVKENKDTNKRDAYIVRDSDNQRKWGLLQYYEKMDEKANASQIQEKAEKLLQIKNRVTKGLKLKCIGDLRVKVGMLVVLDISELKKEGIEQKYFLITKCSHKFSNNMHTMDLEVQVIDT